MRVLFGAHGSALRVFCRLDARLRSLGVVSSSAYWISDAETYYGSLPALPVLDRPDVRTMFEWDVTRDLSRSIVGDRRRAELLARYDDAVLWNAIVADRRLSYGRLAKSVQSYKPRFTSGELCEIVVRALHLFEEELDRELPDAIVTFVPASFGDYLLALVAAQRGIPYWQLRSTKIENFVTFVDSLEAQSSRVLRLYKTFRSQPEVAPFYEEAKAYVRRASSRPLEYEGSVLRRRPQLMRTSRRAVRGLARAIARSVRPPHPDVRTDSHVPPPLGTWMQAFFHAPIRGMRGRRIMGTRLLQSPDLSVRPFVFVPLHSEPEIALSVFGRDHQNQIETVRRIAQSVPLGWDVVVKEHPRSIGYRRSGWYRRLLEIPNVSFAKADTVPFDWILEAEAVVTVSGFIGFEAVAAGKPVIVLGDVAYSMLPSTMVRRVRALCDLGSVLRELLAEYQYDDDAIVSFVAATMTDGVPVNLYSDLLAKPGRVRKNAVAAEDQLDQLALLLQGRLEETAVE